MNIFQVLFTVITFLLAFHGLFMVMVNDTKEGINAGLLQILTAIATALAATQVAW